MAQQNRNSPHLNHLHHNGSAPPSPSMSNSQQQGGQSRQSVGYASPQSYPSPSMSNAQYNYPPPNNQQNEAYRASPTGSNGSLSLPSMRSLDPLQQQQSQHHMGSPLPPPVAQMGGPYYHNQGQTLPHPSHQYANVTSDPNGQGMRYALPVTDSRVMSGGRHKKEIKRRTKTGCLTCRKRRIKCDEAHPACRNCQKSKRECLGYDPIFKNNPGPAAIQPAPSSAPSQPGTSAPVYGNQPQMAGYPDSSGHGNVPPSNLAYDPALSASVSSPDSSGHQIDLLDPNLTIDPNLNRVIPPAAVSGYSVFPHPIPGKPNFYEDLTRGMTSATPYSSGASETPHLRGGASSFPPSVASTAEDLAYTTLPDKRPVKDLLDECGPPPPVLSSITDITQNPAAIDEIKQLWYTIYAPGLESFLESKWFSVKGMSQLLMNKAALEGFAVLLDQFSRTKLESSKDIKYSSLQETRVVWNLITMVRSGVDVKDVKQEAKNPVPDADDALEAARRLDIYEALLTHQVAEGNQLTKPVQGATDPHRYRELDFWYTLGDFVAIKYEDSSSAKEIDDTLGLLRNLLDGRENRDVLYSIAVVRAIGHRVSEYTVNDTPLHLDESDNRSKLAVAKKFVIDEGSGSGTTNVIRRLCELTSRSWHYK